MNLGGFLELSTSYAVDYLTIKLSQLRQESTLEFNGTLKAALSSSCNKYHPTPYQIVFRPPNYLRFGGGEGGRAWCNIRGKGLLLAPRMSCSDPLKQYQFLNNFHPINT